MPSVVDTPALWASERARLEREGPETVVLLGASRMELGFSAEVFRERFPDRPLVQLAMSGQNPMAALRDLAQASRFRGLLICDVTAASFTRNNREDQQAYVDYYHRRYNLNTRLNRAAATAFQERLVVVHPYLQLPATLRQYLVHRILPRPNYLITRRDRTRLADYSKLNIAAHRAERIRRARDIWAHTQVLSPADWLVQAREVEPWVAAIQDRGGRVVFLRLPTSGEQFELDEGHYPRALYWDRLAALSAATFIDFRDLPGADRFNCPDGSHLNYDDAQRFTAILLDDLVRRGALAASCGPR